jgi:hypothetical protein
LLIFAVVPLSTGLFLLNVAATAWGGDSPDRAGAVVYLGNSLPLAVAAFYWPVAILAGYGIVARYRRRHRGRTGLGGPAVWPYLVISLVVCAVLVIEQRGMGWSMNPQYLGPGLTLLLMAYRERDQLLTAVAAMTTAIGALPLAYGLSVQYLGVMDQVPCGDGLPDCFRPSLIRSLLEGVPELLVVGLLLGGLLLSRRGGGAGAASDQ